MKRTVFHGARFKALYLLVLCLFPLSLPAEESGLRVEFQTKGAFFYKDFKPYTLVANVGYDITSRLFVHVEGAYAIDLFKQKGVKDYYADPIAGVNVGYTFLKTADLKLDARIGIGDNFKAKRDWRYNYYDAGVYAHLGSGRVKPIFGAGMRHYNAHSALFKDYTRFYVAIGFGL